MAGDPLRKVLPGQPIQIPAAAVNAWNDAARFVRNQQHNSRTGFTAPVRRADIVRVQNMSGEPRDRFNVLGINGPIFEPSVSVSGFADEVLLIGVTPNATEHSGRFVVLLEPLAAGEIGLAVISGVCLAWVRIRDRKHTFADAGGGDMLSSCEHGAAQILYRPNPEAVGDQLCIVRLSNTPHHVYRLEDCHNDPNKPKKPDLYVSNDLAKEAAEGRVVRIGDTCYKVTRPNCGELPCYGLVCIKIDEIYNDCDRCNACWQLTECIDDTDEEAPEPREIITTTDLAEYEGQVVRIAGDDACWEVSHYGQCPPEDTQAVEVIQHYPACDRCGCYVLYRCGRGQFITVTNDLLAEAQAAGVDASEPSDICDPLGQGPAFLINGDCWHADRFEACDSTATHANVVEVYPGGCNECACIKLTRCDDPEIVRYVHSAVDTDGDPLNLRAYLFQTVRLADNYCYTVERATDPQACENADEDVEVLEAYADCAQCKCWTLYECGSGEPGTTVATYTDLAGHGYEIGQHFRSGDKCYRIVDDEAECAGAISVTPEGRYYSCEHCEKQYRYRLYDVCNYEDCGEPGEGYDRHPSVVTDEDLSAAAGQNIYARGRCWYVQPAGEETPVSDGWEAPLSWSGPYASCASCQSQPVTEVVERERTWHDGTYLVRDVWQEHYEAGVLVKKCPPRREILCECAQPTCYELTSCDDERVIYTRSDLSGVEEGEVLRRDTEDGYWRLTGINVICGYPLEDFTMVGDPLEVCPGDGQDECVRLRRCGTESEPEYVLVDAEVLDGVAEPKEGTIYERDSEEGGGRWEVVDLSVPCDTPDTFTPVGTHDACDDEDPGTLVELQKCGESETSIIVAGEDLTNPAIGSVHKDDNGECWEVVALDADGEPMAFTETASYPPGGDPCTECGGAPPDGCQPCGDQQAFVGQPVPVQLWSAIGQPTKMATYLGNGKWEVLYTLDCNGEVEYRFTWQCFEGAWVYSLYRNGTLVLDKELPVWTGGNTWSTVYELPQVCEYGGEELLSLDLRWTFTPCD